MQRDIVYTERRLPSGRLLDARITRVSYSKSGKTIRWRGSSFIRVGTGEYVDEETGEVRWFTAPRKDGNDRGGNNPGSFPIEIESDVRREYWTHIRGLPERAHEAVTYG